MFTSCRSSVPPVCILEHQQRALLSVLPGSRGLGYTDKGDCCSHTGKSEFMDSTSVDLSGVSGLLHQHLSGSLPFPQPIRKEHTHWKGTMRSVCWFTFCFFNYVYLYWEVCVHVSAVDHRSQRRASDPQSWTCRVL